METLFRKHFWTLQAAVAVVVALLLAAGVTGFLAARLVGFAVSAPSDMDDGSGRDDSLAATRMDLPATVFGPEPEEPAPEDLCAEVACPPGQTCDPDSGGCIDDEPVDEDAADTEDDGRCLESDIAINLVGTMVSDDPRFSLAILQNPTTNKTQFARVGTNLLAEADVLRVERNRITLLRNGREECLRYGDQSTRAQRAQENNPATGPTAGTRNDDRSALTNRNPRDAAQPAASNTGGTFEERVRTSVRRNQDGSYDIDRSLVAEVANNQALMEQQAPNVSPHYVNGRAAGFQLQGIRTGSLFSRIGIRNNDVIVDVNGQAVDSPQRAMELYDAMMSQNEVRLTVQRRGRNQTLVYNVR